MLSIRYGADGTELDVPRNVVKKNMALDKNEVNAKDLVAKVFKYRRGQGNSGKSGGSTQAAPLGLVLS